MSVLQARKSILSTPVIIASMGQFLEKRNVLTLPCSCDIFNV